VLKVIRESIGQTQEQLAERLGVSAATVQGWESGRRPLMAVPTGNLMAIRARLRHLGAAPALLDGLTQGLEADLFVGEILATSHDQAHFQRTPARRLGGHSAVHRDDSLADRRGRATGHCAQHPPGITARSSPIRASIRR
jgi:transcriptional regulator with XRE-family HTH domain